METPNNWFNQDSRPEVRSLGLAWQLMMARDPVSFCHFMVQDDYSSSGSQQRKEGRKEGEKKGTLKEVLKNYMSHFHL